MGDEEVDVTHSFWAFVHDVNRMSFEDLACTPAYEILADACQNDRSLSVQGSTLAVRDGGSPLPEGVRWDACRERYVFADIPALFYGSLDILEMASSPLRAPLAQCIRRMTDTSHDLGDLLRGMTGLRI